MEETQPVKDITKVNEKQEKDNAEYIESINDENNTSPNNNNQIIFPERIIGNIEKRGTKLGFYHYRYLEIDSNSGELRRYLKIEDYPKKPKEIIHIKQLTALKRLKKSSEYYEFQIYFFDGQKLVNQIYKVRHLYSITHWFEAIKTMWTYYTKGKPLLKIIKETLFIDDTMGIQHNLNSKLNFLGNQHIITINDFDIIKLLGYGAFSTVYQVIHKKSKKIYAMKIMDKNILIEKKHLHYVMTEFNILKQISDSVFNLKLFCAFQSANYLYMVIDYCSEGDLTKIDRIENERLLFAELVLAFENLYNKRIIYRDLKPENVLFTHDGHIKLCDFNLAKEGIQDGARAFSFCGSPLYLSPEMLTSKGVSYPADIFGVGLLIYELKTGIPAFYSLSSNKLFERISNVNIDFKNKKIEKDCLDLLKKLLVKDEKLRLSIKEIKQHKYFSNLDWEKVKRKEYGAIKLHRRKDNKRNAVGDFDERKEKQNSQIKKISIKELKKDNSREGQNKIVNFDFISDEFIDIIRNYGFEEENALNEDTQNENEEHEIDNE